MFENLKGMMGDSYHDGITAEEVNNFFAGKKFADLSTGQYVDKNKYEKEIQNLNSTISQQREQINSKLTEDEKKQADALAKDTEIARLQKLLKDNSISSNGDLARSTLANAKTLLDIKDDDKDYNGFLGNIVSEDRDKTSAISSYIAKYINDAYEKGKKDATKDAMGEFGKGKFSGNGGTKKETESLGAKLAKSSPGVASKSNVDYFKRS